MALVETPGPQSRAKRPGSPIHQRLTPRCYLMRTMERAIGQVSARANRQPGEVRSGRCSFYADNARLFQTTAQSRKGREHGVEKDALEMQPTQIGRALRELGTYGSLRILRSERTPAAEPARCRSLILQLLYQPGESLT